MDNYTGGPPKLTGEEIFEQLLGILEQLDQSGMDLAALHVCFALEMLSPGDPRIPLIE